MKAMVLESLADLKSHPTPLRLLPYPEPTLDEGEILIRVTRCGICHTELDIIEGRTPPARLPIVPGHQVVGIVEEGSQAEGVKTGQRVGVAWIFSACGKCEFCRSGRENLCPQFQATGRDADGGYAEYMKVRADFAHAIPDSLSDSEAAPLLCAGAIGYRSLRLTKIEDGQTLGLTGFGGSGHLTLKMTKVRFPGTKVFVFTRNPEERAFAVRLGADWAGAFDAAPPEAMDAVIDTTPVWGPGLEALKRLKAGGRLVVNAIRKEEIDKEVLLRLDYPSHLWMEKEIKSVANVTRNDVREFLTLADVAGIKPEFQEYAMSDANRALVEMKQGQIRGAKVLVVQ
jgi:alcohol dehydrogenase, propanol-preferring